MLLGWDKEDFRVRVLRLRSLGYRSRHCSRRCRGHANDEAGFHSGLQPLDASTPRQRNARLLWRVCSALGVSG